MQLHSTRLHSGVIRAKRWNTTWVRIPFSRYPESLLTETKCTDNNVLLIKKLVFAI